MRRRPSLPRYPDFADFPLYARLADMARVYPESARTIQRKVRAGTWPGPSPIQTHPYLLWRKADVVRDYETRVAPPPKATRWNRTRVTHGLVNLLLSGALLGC